jgi:hypothetical protein
LLSAQSFGTRFHSASQSHGAGQRFGLVFIVGALEVSVDAVLIVLLGLLHVADGIVTYLGLSFFGLEEVNPILNYCSHLLGLGCSITLFKAGELVVVALLFLDRNKMRSRWITATLGSAVLFYSWVVTNNVTLVLEA